MQALAIRNLLALTRDALLCLHCCCDLLDSGNSFCPSQTPIADTYTNIQPLTYAIGRLAHGAARANAAVRAVRALETTLLGLCALVGERENDHGNGDDKVQH